MELHICIGKNVNEIFVLGKMSTNFTGARGLDKFASGGPHLIYKDLNITSENNIGLYTLNSYYKIITPKLPMRVNEN
jgi:hypothetical protein